MKRIEVPRVGVVEFPDDMGDDDIARVIQEQIPEANQPVTWKDHAAEALPAFGGGLAGSVGTIAQGLASGRRFAARRLGVEGEEPLSETGLWDWGQGLLDAAREDFGPAPGMEDSPVRGVAGAMGSYATFLGPAAALRLARAPTAAQVGTPVGMAASAGAGEAAGRAAEAGADEDTQLTAAILGVFPGVVQVAPLGLLLRPLPPHVRKDALLYARRALEQGASEFTVENIGLALQNYIARELHTPEQEVFEHVPEHGTYAGIAASMMQAGAIPFLPRRGPSLGVTRPARETPPEEVTAPLHRQESVEPVYGVHLSRHADLAEIDPGMHGTGFAGQELQRLERDGAPQQLRQRAYFYPQDDPFAMPERESQITGPQVYQSRLHNIYDMRSDPDGLVTEARTRARESGRTVGTEAELLLMERGYSGYRVDAIGNTPTMMVHFGESVPAQRLAGTVPGAEAHLARRRELGESPYMVTWEAVPSTSTEFGAWLSQQPMSVKQEWTREASQFVHDTDLVDQLLQQLGVDTGTVSHGYGAYEGQLSPVVITGIPDAQTADLYALGIKQIMQQDAVPWYRPRRELAGDPSHAQGVSLEFSEPLNEARLAAVQEALEQALPGYGFTRADTDSIDIVNFRDESNQPMLLSDAEFFDRLGDIDKDELGITKSVQFGSETNYLGENIGEAEINHAYRAAGRQDIIPWLRGRAADTAQRQEAFHSRHARRDGGAHGRGAGADIPRGRRAGEEQAVTPQPASGGFSVSEIQSHLDRLADNIRGAPPHVVHDSVDAAPAGLRDQIYTQVAQDTVNAALWNGEVHLFANRFQSLESVERVYLHEVFGHHGIRQYLGDRLNPVLDEIWQTYGVKGHEHLIRRYFPKGTFDPNNVAHRRLLAEERIATMAETGANPSILRRVYAAIREWLREMGFKLRLTDNDMALLLHRSRQVLIQGGLDVGHPLRMHRSEEAPGLYWKLGYLSEKLPGSGTPAQYRSVLESWAKKGQLKRDELRWSGVLDWLAEAGDRKLTREDVQRYLDGSLIGLREKILEHPQYESYTAPGGSNYREFLFFNTLPPSQETIAYRQFDADMRRKYGDRYHGSMTAGESRYHGLVVEQMRKHPVEGAIYHSPHFGQFSTNVLFHVRAKDRTNRKGERILFIEEAQSDWHQTGRKKGYRTDDLIQKDREASRQLNAVANEKQRWERHVASALYEAGIVTNPRGIKLSDLIRVWEYAQQVPQAKPIGLVKGAETFLQETEVLRDQYSKMLSDFNSAMARRNEATNALNRSVPEAPFEKTWHELALKRMILYAASRDYDAIAWTDGKTQADRYDLTQYADAIRWSDAGELFVARKGDSEWTRVVQAKDQETLETYIGKEIAERLVAAEPVEGRRLFEFDEANVPASAGDRILFDVDLEIGGEGMRIFYDQMFPNAARKLTKKYSGTVTSEGVFGEGAPYRVKMGGGELVGQFHTMEEARSYINDLRRERPNVDIVGIVENPSHELPAHVLRLSGEANKAAEAEGFTLFHRGDVEQTGTDAGESLYKRWQRGVDGALDWVVENTWLQYARPLGALKDRTFYLKKRYRALGKVAQIDDMARKVHDTFVKATAEDQRAAYQYLTNRDESPTIIADADVRRRAIAVKRLINQVGDRLAREGMIPEAAREKYRDQYLPRVYLKHILEGEGVAGLGGGGIKAGPMGYTKPRRDIPQDVRDLILGEITDPAYLAARGVSMPLRDLAILDFLGEIAENGEWVLPNHVMKVQHVRDEGGNLRVRQVESGGRTVTPYWLQAEAERLLKQVPYMEAEHKAGAERIAQDMMELANAALESAPTATRDYKQVPNSPRYGALRGLFVRREIYDDVVRSRALTPEDSSLAERMLVNWATKFNSFWKLSKVAMNYPTQVRNFVSNGIMMNTIGDVPMHRVALRMSQALDQMMNNGKYYRLAKKYGAKGASFSRNELARIQRDVHRLRAESDQGNPMFELMELFAKYADWHSNLYQLSEVLWKTAAIQDAMESKGMNEVDAAIYAHNTIFDYSLIPSSVEFLRRYPIGVPFATFYYKAMGAYVYATLKHPHRMAPWAALPWIFSMVFRMVHDVDEEDVNALKLALPEWLRERPGSTYFFPWRDQHGRWQMLDIGYFLPWSAHIAVAWNLGRGEMGRAMMEAGLLGGPTPDVIAAIKTNIDPFTKREIIQHQDLPENQVLQLLNYLWRLSAPTMMTDMGVAGHMTRALTGHVSPNRLTYGEPGASVSQALARAVGVNVYPIDPELSRISNLRRMRAELNNLRSAARRNIQNPNLTDERRQKLLERYSTEIQMRALQIEEYARKSEVPEKLRRPDMGPVETAID